MGGLTDAEIRGLLTAIGILILTLIVAADLIGARRHRNPHRRRAGRSLLDPRDYRPTHIDIDYKHLDARRTWRAILERVDP